MATLKRVALKREYKHCHKFKVLDKKRCIHYRGHICEWNI